MGPALVLERDAFLCHHKPVVVKLTDRDSKDVFVSGDICYFK